MTDRIERELQLDAPTDDVWRAVIGDGWLAEEVTLDLRPGGDARFRSSDQEKRGWVEDVSLPSDAGASLIFWWASDDEPASRVELTIETVDHASVRVRVIESRPLELLDLIGAPVRSAGGERSSGPMLVAA